MNDAVGTIVGVLVIVAFGYFIYTRVKANRDRKTGGTGGGAGGGFNDKGGKKNLK